MQGTVDQGDGGKKRKMRKGRGRGRKDGETGQMHKFCLDTCSPKSHSGQGLC